MGLNLRDDTTFAITGFWSPSRKGYVMDLRYFSADWRQERYHSMNADHPMRLEIDGHGALLLLDAVVREYRSWLI